MLDNIYPKLEKFRNDIMNPKYGNASNYLVPMVNNQNNINET